MRRRLVLAAAAAFAAPLAAVRLLLAPQSAWAYRVERMAGYEGWILVESQFVACGKPSFKRTGSEVDVSVTCRTGFGIKPGRRATVYAGVDKLPDSSPSYQCSRTIALPKSGKAFSTGCTIKLPSGWNQTAKPTRTPQATHTPTSTPVPTSTPIPTATPTPSPSDLGVDVQLVLDCSSVPEMTQIKNVGISPFTALLMEVPGSGQQTLVLGFSLNPGNSYTVRTADPTVEGNSTLIYYPEPSASRYADITIGYGPILIAVYRGFCDGSPTELLNIN